MASAKQNFFASLEIYEELGDKEGIATTYINLAQLFNKLHKTNEGFSYLNKALLISKQIGSKEAIRESYAGLTVLDSTIGNYKSAFEHHKLFVIYRDSIDNEESDRKSLENSMQYEFDKKEIANKAEQEKINVFNEEEKEKQRIITYGVAGVLLVVIIFATLLYKRFRVTHRQKRIIEEKNREVEAKNKDIIDSIKYAKRIQTSLLPTEKYIERILTNTDKNTGA